MSSPIIIYHANCNDGFGAAFAAWMTMKEEDPIVIPANYGEPLPAHDFTGRRVYILDFSYPRGILLELEMQADLLTVLDHHKTAEEELSGLSFARFGTDKSGAVMAWEHFHPGVPMPILFEYIQDRDLWAWKLPDSKAVNEYIRSFDFDLDTWERLLLPLSPGNLSEAAREGYAILRTKEREVANHVTRAREVVLAGHSVLAVNTTIYFSEIAGRLAAGRPFGIGWFQRQDGRYQYSLRSDESGVDVSEIAQLLGGGGHEHAAGFESDSLLF